MKSLNYVLEFNSSKNFKLNTPQIWTFLSSNVQIFSTMQYHGQTHLHRYFLLCCLQSQKQLNFGRRIHWILQKKNKKPRGFMQSCFPLCILNVWVSFYYIFINFQLLWLLHNINPSPLFCFHVNLDLCNIKLSGCWTE